MTSTGSMAAPNTRPTDANPSFETRIGVPSPELTPTAKPPCSSAMTVASPHAPSVLTVAPPSGSPNGSLTTPPTTRQPERPSLTAVSAPTGPVGRAAFAGSELYVSETQAPSEHSARLCDVDSLADAAL